MQDILTSIVAFVSTNLDDIFLLMLFYASGKFSKSNIMIGQYLGMAVLVMISLAGSYIGSFFSQKYVGLLGLFPIYIAIRETIAFLRGKKDDNDTQPTTFGVLAVAGVTIANGGDNIGVYIPLMAYRSLVETIPMILVFAVATYLWCLLAQYLANHPVIARQLERYGHILTPIVLFLLGVYILVENNSFKLL